MHVRTVVRLPMLAKRAVVRGVRPAESIGPQLLYVWSVFFVCVVAFGGGGEILSVSCAVKKEKMTRKYNFSSEKQKRSKRTESTPFWYCQRLCFFFTLYFSLLFRSNVFFLCICCRFFFFMMACLDGRNQKARENVLFFLCPRSFFFYRLIW